MSKVTKLAKFYFTTEATHEAIGEALKGQPAFQAYIDGTFLVREHKKVTEFDGDRNSMQLMTKMEESKVSIREGGKGFNRKEVEYFRIVLDSENNRLENLAGFKTGKTTIAAYENLIETKKLDDKRVVIMVIGKAIYVIEGKTQSSIKIDLETSSISIYLPAYVFTLNVEMYTVPSEKVETSKKVQSNVSTTNPADDWNAEDEKPTFYETFNNDWNPEDETFIN